MNIPKIFDSEYRFATILWEHEPIATSELVKLCSEQLGWKRTTSYTVLKRLCDRKILLTQDSIVTSLISKEEIQRSESTAFIDRTFSGSIPQFIAAFTSGKTLSQKEVDEIKKLIEEYEEG